MDVDGGKGEGFRPYYITKIEELQLIVAEKSQNLRRLQAQRNELNAKGNLTFLNLCRQQEICCCSSNAQRGIDVATRTGQLCG